MKRLIALHIFALLPIIVLGQSNDQAMPTWAHGYFQEFTNSYIEVVNATGYDVKSARENAAKEAIHRRSLATGAEAIVSIGINDITVNSSHNVIVKSRILDEHIEHISTGYRVYLLIQTAKNPTYDYEPVSFTDKYPASLRALVPGMAQIYKGSINKACIMIAGEVVSVAGIVIAESLKASNMALMNQTSNVEHKKEYSRRVSMYSNISYGCIAGAAAVYAWSLIDGLVAKGKQHLVVGNYAMNITPYINDYSTGISLAICF